SVMIASSAFVVTASGVIVMSANVRTARTARGRLPESSVDTTEVSGPLSVGGGVTWRTRGCGEAVAPRASGVGELERPGVARTPSGGALVAVGCAVDVGVGVCTA